MHKVCILVLKNVPKLCLSCDQTVPNLCTSCAKTLSHSENRVQPIELHSERKVRTAITSVLRFTKSRNMVWRPFYPLIRNNMTQNTVRDSRESLVGTKYLFSQEGRFAFQEEFTRDMTSKMKTKKLIACRWVLKQNWHVSSIIIRSKVNLLTEPENKNKQEAWIILLLSINCTFLVREIFLKSSYILY